MRAELDKRAMTEPPTEPAPAGPVPMVHIVPPPPVIAPKAIAPWYADRVGWVLTASGALALAGSAGLFSSAAGLEDDANHTSAQRTSAELHDRAHTRSLFGAAVGVGGVALLASGILKLVVTPSFAITPGGVVAFGRF
jgi:hypothetical protein